MSNATARNVGPSKANTTTVAEDTRKSVMVSFRCPARLIEAVRAISERTGWSDSATLVTLLDTGIDAVQGDGKKGAERHRWVEAAENLHQEEERAAAAILAAKAEYRRLTKGAGKEPPLVPSVRRRKARDSAAR